MRDTVAVAYMSVTRVTKDGVGFFFQKMRTFFLIGLLFVLLIGSIHFGEVESATSSDSAGYGRLGCRIGLFCMKMKQMMQKKIMKMKMAHANR